MAVVLSTEESSYFAPSMRRSHSQPKFGAKNHTFHTSASASRISDLYHQDSSRSFSTSTPSSAPSSPETIHVEAVDISSDTPSSFSLDTESESDGQIDFPQYDQYEDMGYFNPRGHGETLNGQQSPPSPRSGLPYASPAPSPAEHDDSAATSRPGSPDVLERAEDDIALRIQPSRHVDYLSHNWREEDIWSSWKLIVSRRGDYSNAARLENASWRTWMKSKNNLGTVSPETLNWLKDCDVTWLYGPLQTGMTTMNPASTDSNSARLSKSNSFVNKSKKPILKKRSMSEIMLQRSLSTSSLVKQAAAAVQAQQKGGLKRTGRRPGLERATTDYITFPFSSRGVSYDGTSLFPSAVSSGFTSPASGERKHIHFNEQVAQCIAVEAKGDDDDDDEMDVDRYKGFDSDSDDGAIMMKRTNSNRRRPLPRRSVSSRSVNGESKTIAMLPSTTLKYREDTPEPTETAMKHSTGVFRGSLTSPSSSQETLRPAKKSGKFFVDDDDDDDDSDKEDEDESNSRPDRSFSSLKPAGEGSFGLKRSSSSSSLSAEPAGMRRTASGMFMPYDENESNSTSESGLIGRVIETKEAAFKSSYLHRLPGSRSSSNLRDVR